ncbi:MAG: uracil-DNA glycosylase [Thermoleophilia bacterium]
MASGREDKLQRLSAEVVACQRCELAATRTMPVTGSGNPEARIVFVGEAPGYNEDQQGLPFVGRAGRLLDELLARIGLTRDDVFIANVLKCRPPDNRDPLAGEIELCRAYLEQQIDIIQPEIVCTMGNFSTRLLSGNDDGITRVHGKPQPFPGHENTRIFPVFHPAAALYTRSNLALLEQDFDYLKTLLADEKTQPVVEPAPVEPDEEPETGNGKPEPEQLGLF